ncbi:Anaerobic glycerol-3-phosphate dehydrogenase subunit B [Minicystis rosea]|nr:Anaerobic glycerol-3-phosphate dehydrogenase subunit B [Minicystis rosea]
MTARVIIVGAGIAGLAAAWSARRAGREVTLVSAQAGATALSGGAVDEAPWEQLLRATRLLGETTEARPLAPEVAAFVDDLQLWDVPHDRSVWLATIAGRVRPARGRDLALLDLGPLAGQLVLLPRADRAAWDADAIAVALSADPVAKSKGISFRAVDAAVLRFDDERRIADGDLALRHDEPARRAWLVDRLRSALAAHPRAGAILLGPWLGVAAPQAGELSRTLGVPVGEALAGAGSPAGMRFEAARDALLERLGVHRRRGRVDEVQRGEQGLEVFLSGQTASQRADAVVLAIGGLAGGGVLYAPPEHEAGADLAPRGRVPFALSLRAPVVLSLGAPRAWRSWPRCTAPSSTSPRGR